MGREAGEDVGTYAFALGSLSAGTNYTLSMALAAPEFSITPKLITVTPDADQTKVFGTADPTPFTYTFAPALEGTDVIAGLRTVQRERMSAHMHSDRVRCSSN